MNKTKLRESISAKCSNSWVKAKKKLTIEKDYDPYIAKKSLWHSLRMANFGTQIAKIGKIKDYTALNHYLHVLLNDMPDDWEILKYKYQPIYNAWMSTFRYYVPKEK